MGIKLRSFALAAVMFLLTANAWGQTVVVSKTATGNYSVTIPAGVVSSTVECWGAGGSGTTSSGSINYTVGGGGGGGAYVKFTSSTIPAGTYNYFVGTTSSNVTPTPATNGSYFGNTGTGLSLIHI